ncbi:MAG: KamA family radical SAM protein [Kiritimatiellia bacterium]
MTESYNNREWNSWKWQLRNAVHLQDLPRFFPGSDFSGCEDVDALFPVRITPYYLRLIQNASGGGPLRRMVLPDIAELKSGGYSTDPFGECSDAARCRGVKQRFPDRILIMTSKSCAANCRHCTRRGLLSDADIASRPEDLDAAVQYVKSHPAIREVLLSGGDPLMLPDDEIIRFVDAFSALDQIDAVRVGSRVPVTLPMRITEQLAERLGDCGRVWLNTQFNHSSEITPESTGACRRLVEAGIPVSNQSVLLRGVNDSVDVMFELCSGLQRIRVRPYYVFMCDPIAGIEHFRVPKDQAIYIQKNLAKRIGGLALPRFVEDIPGTPHKMPI